MPEKYGTTPESHDMKEMRVLNRIVRVVDAGLLYAPDPRHVELLAKGVNLDMKHSTSRVAPGNKPTFQEEPAEDTLENFVSSIFKLKLITHNLIKIASYNGKIFSFSL